MSVEQPGLPTLATGTLARVDRGAADTLLHQVDPADQRIRAEFGPRVLADAATDPTQQPVVGDQARLRRLDDDRWLVEGLLPRRTAITRASVSPGSSQRQVLAANIDIVAITEPVNAAPKPGRIERLLAIAWDSGATPVVLLTKADLAIDVEATTREVAAMSPGVDVMACSTTADPGTTQVLALLDSVVTIAFIGPSGSGKSSLVNALAGADVMAIGDVRTDHRGRHTTVHRELVVLPSGARVIDTPGLRSVGLTTHDALDQVFADLEEFAASCRFVDCQHDTEPNCAVLSAIESGLLDNRRLESWRKLQREAAWLERRHDARKRAEERAKWKAISKRMRGHGRGID